MLAVVPDLFSKNTPIEDFVSALQKEPRKFELSINENESLLMCVVKWKDAEKLKQLVSLGFIIDENIAAEKCQGPENKVNGALIYLFVVFFLLHSLWHLFRNV